MFDDKIHSLHEELIMLCEIRGELDPIANEETEKQIARITKEINTLEGLQTV